MTGTGVGWRRGDTPVSGRVYTGISHPANSSMPSESLDTFSRYVPRLIRDLMARGQSDPSVEFVEGTMIFADLSGFTALSERLAQIGREGAERVTETVNRFFSAILDVTDTYGGDNLKFGGDALLLLFTGKQHADRAVQAALKTRTLVSEIGNVALDGRPVRLGMSFGLHTGTFVSAVAGRPGDRMLHYMLGDESRRVAEAESEASSGQVVITPETLACLQGNYSVRTHGDMHRVTRFYGEQVRWSPGTAHEACPDAVTDFVAVPIREAIAESATGELPSEHRKAWVLFMGVEGFEEILAESGTEPALEVLTAFSAAAIERAQAHGGLVLGTDIDERGFKVIFLFGVPAAREDDAPNAGRLAVRLRDDLREIVPELKLRVGLNSGFVFSGDVGSKNRREYTVMGDTVNLSARLMNVAIHGEVVVSDNFINDVGSAFRSTRKEPVSLKGKSRPQENFRLDEELAETEVVASGTEFVGRKEDFAKLVGLGEQAARGDSVVAAITGPVGIGKTRLVTEVETELCDKGWVVVHGPSRSHATRTPFSPWRPVLESITELVGVESNERTSVLSTAVQRLAPAHEEFTSLLNGILGTNVAESDLVKGLNADVRAERFRELIVALVAGHCETARTVLTFDDLHWADAASVELIGLCASTTRQSRLLMLITSRDSVELPGVEPIVIPLQELDAGIAVTMLQQVVGADAAGGDSLATLVNRTGGNPLFLETVGMAIRASTGDSETGFVIPDRLQTLVMSRIDALPAPERDVLRTAAVINGSIDATTISVIDPASGSPATVTRRLNSLNQMGFLDNPGGIATFRHAVVQEACYDSLAYSTRRRLHLGMVDHLETSGDNESGDIYESLLHHSLGGGDRTRVVEYGVKSARRARDLYAFDVAIEHYGTALASVETSSSNAQLLRANIYEKIGECHAERGRYPDAAGSYASALRSWRRNSGASGDIPPYLESGEAPRLMEPAIIARIGQAWERASEYRKALRWLDQALSKLPTRPGALKGQIETSRSVVLFRMGRYNEAIEWGRRGLATTRRFHDVHQLAHAHNMLAMSFVELGRLNESIPHRERALAFYQQLNDITGQAAANTNLGTCYQLTGNLELALEHYSTALEQSERLGNSTVVAIVNNNIGEVLLARGQFDEAATHFARAANPPVEIGGFEALRGLADVNLCRIARQTDRLEEAREHIESAIKLLVHAGARGLLTEAKLEEAELELAGGDRSRARRLANRSLGFARESGSELLVARAVRIIGQIDLAERDFDRALEQMTESASVAAHVGAEQDHALALMGIADAVIACKSSSTKLAMRSAEQAIRILSALGASHELRRAQQLRETLAT